MGLPGGADRQEGLLRLRQDPRVRWARVVAPPHTSGDRRGAVCPLRSLAVTAFSLTNGPCFRALPIGGGLGVVWFQVAAASGRRLVQILCVCPAERGLTNRPCVLGVLLSYSVVCSPERRCCFITLQTRSPGKSLKTEVSP